MNISDRDIARVREAVPIAEIARLFTALQPAGDGDLLGRCPLHAETYPSFHVTPARGMWFCFGCGEGGDVIAFAEKVYGLEFAEAVQRLAERAGLELTPEVVLDPAAVRVARAARAGVSRSLEQRDVNAVVASLANWLASDAEVRSAAADPPPPDSRPAPEETPVSVPVLSDTTEEETPSHG